MSCFQEVLRKYRNQKEKELKKQLEARRDFKLRLAQAKRDLLKIAQAKPCFFLERCTRHVLPSPWHQLAYMLNNPDVPSRIKEVIVESFGEAFPDILPKLSEHDLSMLAISVLQRNLDYTPVPNPAFYKPDVELEPVKLTKVSRLTKDLLKCGDYLLHENLGGIVKVPKGVIDLSSLKEAPPSLKGIKALYQRASKAKVVRNFEIKSRKGLATVLVCVNGELFSMAYETMRIVSWWYKLYRGTVPTQLVEEDFVLLRSKDEHLFSSKDRNMLIALARYELL